METKLVDLAINHMYFKKSVTFVTISSIDDFINMNTFKVEIHVSSKNSFFSERIKMSTCNYSLLGRNRDLFFFGGNDPHFDFSFIKIL